MANTNKAEIIKLCNNINKKEGEGTIYLCRGLDEAKKFAADIEQEAKEKKSKKTNALINEYTNFLEENLIGTWKTEKPVTLFGPTAEVIEFLPNEKIRLTMTDESNVELEWMDMTVGVSEFDKLVATITTSDGEELILICTNNTFTACEFYMNGSVFTKIQQ